MAASELKPLLELVPTQSIRFHEHPEGNRTERLRKRIERDAQLRNPPIVTGMGDGRYLLLDGANRVSAFLALGYSMMPVQLVDYGDPAVQLKGWHHLLLEGAPLTLREQYEKLPGVRVEAVGKADLDKLLELRQVLCVLVEDAQRWWGLFPDGGSGDLPVRQRVGILEAIVGAYEGQSRLERIKLANYDQLPAVVANVQHRICLFPTLRKEELLQAAGEGLLIPTGLTRHLIPGRALGINLKLDFLTSEGSDDDKKARFSEFVENLAMEGRIRFYEESVFIMNE